MSQGHEKQEFEQPRAAGHEESERASKEPPPHPRYTLFVLRLIWVVVVVPFIAGAVLAYVLSPPGGTHTPAQLPERTERTISTTPPYSTTPETTGEETTGSTTATATVSPSN